MTARTVYGVGINDEPRSTGVQGKDGKREVSGIYSKWTSMMQRCYSKQHKERKPTYDGCTVCDEWLVFSAFRLWVESQDWKGKHLDKDLIKKGNKIYSPEFCCFINAKTNNIFIGEKRSRVYRKGVQFNKLSGKYVAQFVVNGKSQHIGMYDNEIDASNAHIKKRAVIMYFSAMSQSCERVRQALLVRALDEAESVS